MNEPKCPIKIEFQLETDLKLLLEVTLRDLNFKL